MISKMISRGVAVASTSAAINSFPRFALFATNKMNEGVLLGMGNPLLDLQLIVKNPDLLDKYDLKHNDQILAEDKHRNLFEEIVSRDDIQMIPGGATQNALRVFQWIVKKPNCATFFGAVGEDNYAEILRQKSRDAGVNVQYQINPAVKTGTCAALIYQQHRSLVADLAAANTFTVNHLKTTANWEFVEKAKFYYISGFFLTVCPEAIQMVADHAKAANKPFLMNLAAPFICQIFGDRVNAVLPYIDVLFANEVEAKAYAKKNGFETDDIAKIALRISALPKENKARPRVVIFTQGADPILVASEGRVREFPVPPLEHSQIVDTNGAGDGFCGGFLAEFVQGKPLEDCVKCGMFAAETVIQQQGCTVPATKCPWPLNQ